MEILSEDAVPVTAVKRDLQLMKKWKQFRLSLLKKIRRGDFTAAAVDKALNAVK